MEVRDPGKKILAENKYIDETRGYETSCCATCSAKINKINKK